MSRLFVAFLILSLLLVAGCSASSSNDEQSVEESAPREIQGERVSTESGTYTNISVAEFQSMLAQKDFELINVHIPFEGNIPETDRSIPYNEIDQHLDQLPTDKDAKLVLYCRSDHMSTIASERLVELGYTNIWNLKGGMIAWEKAGLPLEK